MCRRQFISSRRRKLRIEDNVSFDNSFYMVGTRNIQQTDLPASNEEDPQLGDELNSPPRKDIVDAMDKRLKPRRMRGRRGQALAEFIVCLVGLMIMFLGLMLVGALGAKNVECFMESREMADRNSDGVFGGTDGKVLYKLGYIC